MFNLKVQIMLRNFLHSHVRLLYVFFLFFSFSIHAQQAFFEIDSRSSVKAEGKQLIVPNKYQLVQASHSDLTSYLIGAPHESQVSAKNSGYLLDLPMPNGSMQSFSIVESPIFEQGLAAKFPNIKTYLGQGVDDKTASVRLDISPSGFHAMVRSNMGIVFIDPYTQHNTEYIISYFKKDFSKKSGDSFNCRLDDSNIPSQIAPPTPLINNESEENTISQMAVPTGTELRKYKLALATTGEYATFHGGTVALTLAAMTTTINRVNEIFENDLAVRLILVTNTSSLIETNATTDPYTNGNTGLMINEVHAEITAVIGSANFDIGHLFGTDSGGLAGLGVVCSDTQKGRGVTGSSNPIGDPFDIDYVSHEVGHQFGAQHTQNNTCNRASNSAYEPGSASTIMGYAGICAPNLQTNSDAIFHSHSYDQIQNHIDGTTCADVEVTTNNAPVANAGTGGYTIPISTPFELTGSGTDVDGDALTYIWEQRDLGPETNTLAELNNPLGNAPIFRVWTPSTDPTRTFPRLTDLLNNTTSIGEILPTYTRSLNFRFAVRDNHAGAGGLDHDDLTLDVSTVGGPFLAQYPNGGETIAENELITVTWDVANTTLAPINCSHVSILLSTDGGFTYPISLATNIANDGSQDVTIPLGLVPTGQPSISTCRVKVKAENNVFFDISNFNFNITPPTTPDFTLNPSANPIEICSPTISIDSLEIESILAFDDTVQLTVTGVPTGATFTFGETDVMAGNTTSITFDPGTIAAGNYTITVTGTFNTLIHTVDINYAVADAIPTTANLTAPLDAEIDVPVGVNFDWDDIIPVTNYTIEIATDINFTAIIQTGTATESNYFPSPSLDLETEYFWRIKSTNACGESLWSDTLSFTTTSIPLIFGCTDPTAFNYNPDATADDGSCEAIVMGCTNPDATNYNVDANVDDGSCLISGCTDSTAINYNPDANVDNGNCVIHGCTDPLAFNYNPNATFDDGSCDSVSIGCTDPTAINYDPTANIDNGFCITSIEGCTDTTAYNYNPNANVYDASCVYIPQGCTDSTYNNYDPNAGIDDGSCSNFPVFLHYSQVADSTYTFWLTTSPNITIYSVQWEIDDIIFGQTTDSITYEFTTNGIHHIEAFVTTNVPNITYYRDTTLNLTIWGCTDVYATNFNFNASIDDGSCIGAVYGCTDSLADNYNAASNTNDGSCSYTIEGCTDNTAFNYNPQATTDDGSCIPVVMGCTDSTALNYNANANTDDGTCLLDLEGCTDPTAFNYNPIATLDDGSCIPVVFGCMDPSALNYDANVNTDDGSCNYSPTSDPIWTVTPTSENHTILIPTTATMDINGGTLAIGDYIGVFYDDAGVLKCGGLIVWSGSNATISAYGAEDGEDNGFQTGETFEWKVWDASGLITLNASVTYDTNMPNLGTYAVDGISAITALEASSGQAIDLVTGWNFVSTYINPDDADISVSMAPIADNIFLAKDEDGSVYWPNFNINNIGDLTIGKAYKVKMDDAATWNVIGNIVDPTDYDLTLETGWSYLGYLRTHDALISSALSSISANIFLVKDGEGNVYWPQFNINNIGNMEAGQGYQINMNNVDTLTYAANTVNLASAKVLSNTQPEFYSSIAKTGSNMTVAIPATIIDGLAEEGDEIAAFNSNGQLIGSAVYTASNIALTIWGDDSSTEEVENIATGEIFQLRLWSSSEEKEFTLDYDLNSDIEYKKDGVAIINALRKVTIAETINFSIYPNPVNNMVNVDVYSQEESSMTISIYNQLGVKVIQLEDSKLEEGQNVIQLDMTNLHNGLYHIILTDQSGGTRSARITIVH